MIGYLLARALMALLPQRPILSALTQVEVAADDPAFAQPTKPIGPFYAPEEWRRLAATHGWTGVEDRGQMRRVVPSPLPKRIVERDAIARVWQAGVLAICAGGGGIPVARDESGALRGVEAVVDKDRTAALLAADLGADVLLLLTDVAGVYASWTKPDARLLRTLSAREAAALALPPGSMGPKVEAALWFARRGKAVIAALDQALPALAGDAGTLLEP
jgi:carbamate kinase